MPRPMQPDMADRYLDLLEEVPHQRDLHRRASPAISQVRGGARACRPRSSRHCSAGGSSWGRFDAGDVEALHMGREWPPPRFGETLVGSVRLRNLRDLLTVIVREDIPGDAFEAGAWRGGAAIYMRAILEALGDTTRESGAPTRSRAFRAQSIPKTGPIRTTCPRLPRASPSRSIP